MDTESVITSGGELGGISDDYARVIGYFAGLDSVLVAFSGGVDSSLLLAAAHDALGSKVLAVTAISSTYPVRERATSAALVQDLGVRHIFIETHELKQVSFHSNPVDRCYYCKRELYGELRQIADRENFAVMVDGTNADDLSDVRPGRRASREFGVRSPLLELGFGKNSIRRMARARGLVNWNQPACACLASRIPYGEEITDARLRRIEAVEDILGRMGFRMLRVRDYGKLARIEVAEDEIAFASSPDMRRKIIQACISNGYLYACVDLAGYRTGSMNEALPETVIRQLMAGNACVPVSEDTKGASESMSCCC